MSVGQFLDEWSVAEPCQRLGVGWCTIPEQVGPGCVRKEAECEPGSKPKQGPNSSTASASIPAFRFRPELLPWLPSWMNYKLQGEIKALLSKVRGVYHSHRKQARIEALIETSLSQIAEKSNQSILVRVPLWRSDLIVLLYVCEAQCALLIHVCTA